MPGSHFYPAPGVTRRLTPPPRRPTPQAPLSPQPSAWSAAAEFALEMSLKFVVYCSGPGLSWCMERRTACCYLACCYMLLTSAWSLSEAILPLACLTLCTFVASEHAATQRAPGAKAGLGAVAWLPSRSELRRFGRAAFFCGGLGGEEPASPNGHSEAQGVRRSSSGSELGVRRSISGGTFAASPDFERPPPDRSASAVSRSASGVSRSNTLTAFESEGAANASATALARAAPAPTLATLTRHEAADLSSPGLRVEAAKVEAAMQAVLRCAEAHQWLEAGLRLRSLDATVGANPSHPAVLRLQRSLLAADGSSEVKRAVETCRARYRECLEALRLLSQQEGWAYAEEHRGATTHFKHDAAGRLWLKTEGVMEDVSMLECVALWKELDLFERWFPLCTGSAVLARQGRVELLAWIQMAAGGLPIGKRDAVLHGYGVDGLDDGFMLVIGRSALQADFPRKPFPRLSGLGSARMHVQGLQVLIQPLSERSVRCCYIINIDLRAPLPRPVVDFATQKVIASLFHALRREARRIRLGAAESAHAARMAQDAETYFGWMQPRMRLALEAIGVVFEGEVASVDEQAAAWEAGMANASAAEEGAS